MAGRRNVSWQEGGLLPGKKKEYVPAGKKCPCRKEECALTGRRNVPRQEGGIWSCRQKKYPGRKEECILTGGRHVSRQKGGICSGWDKEVSWQEGGMCPGRKEGCDLAKRRKMFWQV